jgi:hypothetical protein
MAVIRKLASVEGLIAMAFNLFLLATHLCLAQAPSVVQNTEPVESGGHGLGATLYSAAHEATALGNAPAPSSTAAPADDQWHIAFFPYLWFPGMHGYTGVLGFYTGVKASPGATYSRILTSA